MSVQHYARVVDGVVTEPPIDFDPEGFYAKEVLDTFVPCPDDVVQGSVYDAKTGEFTNPVGLAPTPEPTDPAPVEPTYRTAVSKTEYYGLFTPVEEATIRLTASKTVTAEMVETASAEDRQKLMAVLVLRVMLDRVDKLATTQIIQLGDAQVAQGLALCLQMGLLEDHRPAEIVRGVLDN